MFSDLEMVKGSKIDRECMKCGSIIPAGPTIYYMRVADMEYTPHIENVCCSCMEQKRAAS